jgi:hypothetical protein
MSSGTFGSCPNNLSRPAKSGLTVYLSKASVFQSVQLHSSVAIYAGHPKSVQACHVQAAISQCTPLVLGRGCHERRIMSQGNLPTQAACCKLEIGMSPSILPDYTAVPPRSLGLCN